jgi:hypothetical protein
MFAWAAQLSEVDHELGGNLLATLEANSFSGTARRQGGNQVRKVLSWTKIKTAKLQAGLDPDFTVAGKAPSDWIPDSDPIDIDQRIKDLGERYEKLGVIDVRGRLREVIAAAAGMRNSQMGLSQEEVRRVTERAAQALEINAADGMEDSVLESTLRRVFIERLFESLQTTWDGMDTPQRAEAERKLKEFVDELDENAQTELSGFLGGGSITVEAILKSAAGGVVAAAFATGVNATGFGAYLALTTGMHALFTTLLGVTLPFTAYTTATSGLALITGPWLLLPVALWSIHSFRKQARVWNARLLPYALVALGSRPKAIEAG